MDVQVFTPENDARLSKYHTIMGLFFPDEFSGLQFLNFIRSLFVKPWPRLPFLNKILTLRAPVEKPSEMNIILKTLVKLCQAVFHPDKRYLDLDGATKLRDFHAISTEPGRLGKEWFSQSEDLPIVHTSDAQAHERLMTLMSRLKCNQFQVREWLDIWESLDKQDWLFHWIFHTIRGLKTLEKDVSQRICNLMAKCSNNALSVDLGAGLIMTYFDDLDLQEFAREEMVYFWRAELHFPPTFDTTRA